MMVYTCDRCMINLEFKYEDNKLIGTVLDNKCSKWVFSDITNATFHWLNVTVLEDGSWKINSNVSAKRKE